MVAMMPVVGMSGMAEAERSWRFELEQLPQHRIEIVEYRRARVHHETRSLYRRTTGDRTQTNDYSTTGNVNPTGKSGTTSATK